MKNQETSPSLLLSSSEDRRDNIRLRGHRELVVDLGASSGLAHILDISWTGVRLESNRPIPAGSLVRLSDTNFNGKTRVWGVCRWCCPSPISSGPEITFWSGIELQTGPLSPSRQWVSENLRRMGLREADLANRRRNRRYHCQIQVTLLLGPNDPSPTATLLNFSSLGACLVASFPILRKELAFDAHIEGHSIRMSAFRRAVRKLPEGSYAHHVTWEGILDSTVKGMSWLQRATLVE
jgi:hypothetical protein